MKRPSRTLQRGSTLIEALAVTLILSTVLGLTTSLFASATRVFSRETTSADLQVDLASAKNLLLDDLSVVGYSPDGAAATPAQHFPEVRFAGGRADLVAFAADVDSDGTTERVCYRLESGRLERVIGPFASACAWDRADTLARDVTSLDLTFLDASRNVLTQESQVTAGAARTVRVEVGMSSPTQAGPIAKALVGEVAFRN